MYEFERNLGIKCCELFETESNSNPVMNIVDEEFKLEARVWTFV